MGFWAFIHSIVDAILGWVRLAQNRQVGWPSVVRKTGVYEREQQPLSKKLKLLFLFNPLTEWIDTTHSMRLHMHRRASEAGRKERSKLSHKHIAAFVDFYHIRMDEFEPSDISQYASFEDFFTRAHKPESRPIANKQDSRHAIVVADSRVVVYESVALTKKLWIKGTDFSITNLVMDTRLGAHFGNGAIASFRLSPQDYHRYHSPVTGKVKECRSLPGDYYQVDPVALQSRVNILTCNARRYIVIESPEFGDVLFVAIGASDVGTVCIHEKFQQPGQEVRKGDELGMFEFGASSIIVAFEEGRMEFDKDLLELSKRRIMVAVDVGMSLGQATAITRKP